jgi:hypothetical protein
VKYVILLLLLTGCAAAPPKVEYITGMQVEKTPLDTPFERCMASVGKSFYYTSDRVTAANWCYAHDNGGIK